MLRSLGPHPARLTGSLLALTLAAGVVDALSLLAFGVFTANMTGNVVLLGVGIADGVGGQALRCAVAVLAFAAGAFLAARLVGTPEPGRIERVSAALATTLALQLVLMGGWLAADGEPNGAVRAGLIAASAAAMGSQSAAVLALRVPGVTTTYITGPLTGLVTELANGLGRGPERDRRLAMLVALVAGTVAGALLVKHVRVGAAAVPVLLTAGTVAAARLARTGL